MEDYLTRILVLSFCGCKSSYIARADCITIVARLNTVHPLTERAVPSSHEEHKELQNPFAGCTALRTHQGSAKPFLARAEVALSADLIWPLLIDNISTGEKISVAVRFASTLLREYI